MNIANIYNILMELGRNPSILKKLEILKREEGNDDLRLFFYYALESKMVYGIKKNPQSDSASCTENKDADIPELLESLSTRQITGNEAISAVKTMNEQLDEQGRYILDCILQKNPRCGVSKATIEKIWPGLVSTDIKLCKAQPYSNKNMEKIKYPALSQRKCDGARCLAFVSGDSVKFMSSNGIEYQKIGNHLSHEALKYGRYFPTNENLNDYVLDGELLVERDGKILSRKQGNGILNKALKGTISDEEAFSVRMVIWDVIPYDEYEMGKGTHNYFLEFDSIKAQSILNEHKYITVVETKEVYDKKEAIYHFREMIRRGEEGTIVKGNDFVWENKRSVKAVKLKIEIDTTMKITGTFEGNEKYKGMLGGITCQSSDGLVTVNVGSGFTDADRKELWTDDIIGKFVEIRSNGIILNESGNYSLFLPRFIEFRNDKDEADSFETISALSFGSNVLR